MACAVPGQPDNFLVFVHERHVQAAGWCSTGRWPAQLAVLRANCYVAAMQKDTLPDSIDALAHQQQQLRFWQKQAAQLERDRRGLKFVPPIGLGVSAVMALLLHEPRWAWVAVAITVSLWIMGLYLTTVRRQEYAYNVEETQREIRALQGDTPL